MAVQTIPIDLANLLPASFSAPGLTEEQFLELCEKFPDALLEYTPQGEVLIMPPTDPDTGFRSSEIHGQLYVWAQSHGGRVIGPDTGFRLPGGSRRSPDAAWFDEARWLAARREGTRFPVFAPEFVIEMRSPGDRLAVLREKVQEYLDAGVQLGWLVDPEERAVTIYRPGREPEVVRDASAVAGEGPVAGFVLSVARVFD